MHIDQTNFYIIGDRFDLLFSDTKRIVARRHLNALNANHGVFSPDGRHMVFAAMEPASQQWRIAIVDLPER